MTHGIQNAQQEQKLIIHIEREHISKDTEAKVFELLASLEIASAPIDIQRVGNLPPQEQAEILHTLSAMSEEEKQFGDPEYGVFEV